MVARRRKMGFALVLVFFVGILGYMFTAQEVNQNRDRYGRQHVAKATLKRAVHEQPARESLVPNEDLEVYEARLNTFRIACAQMEQPITSRNRFIHYETNDIDVSYCSVPKVGCTFWGRVFQFLLRTNGSREVSSPLDITRYQVHFLPLVHIKEIKINQNIIEHSKRFFFVRNPYTRLFSAYVDKFVLPQFLSLENYGLRIAKFKGQTIPNPNTTCVNDLSFKDFVQHLVIGDPIGNYHWKPMYSSCNPCKLFPHFIGKQESFNKDAKYILREVGLGHILEKYSHKKYISDEIAQMVDFTFSFRDRMTSLRRCFDDISLTEKIWTTFQINGHLKPDMKFPKATFKRILEGSLSTKDAKKRVTKEFVRVNENAHISHELHSTLKLRWMLKAFKSLTRDTMEQIAKYYDIDFKLFGYEKYPKDLFPWRYTNSSG
ncbi:carbohydrate sulfotransferase 8-like [Haliotis rufescens]|uniref:carbohydrate sulfotransferase 8-like n=1 Tax=Haliotis rufescens TaxID=6454 RepID=UPI00201ED8AD|nr:carbohydrate sulfotransferase 8-like [Haliotis rufescens]